MTTQQLTPDTTPSTHAQPEPTAPAPSQTNQEPTFTLRAQDLTADLVIDFWILVQLRVRHAVKQGTPVAVAIEDARKKLGIPAYPPILGVEKLDGAARIATAMTEWTGRKLAD